MYLPSFPEAPTIQTLTECIPLYLNDINEYHGIGFE
jgi:hypothetical protein